LRIGKAALISLLSFLTTAGDVFLGASNETIAASDPVVSFA
jgi:hypothetical protein